MAVLQRLRGYDKQTNVLILSARADLEDKIAGLDEGANDYMTKPFHFDEFLARVRALLRRRTVQERRVLTCGAITMDTASRQVCAGGRPITLTAKETALLEYLLIHPGETISQARLIEHIWGKKPTSFPTPFGYIFPHCAASCAPHWAGIRSVPASARGIVWRKNNAKVSIFSAF